MIRGRVPPVLVLVGRALLIVLAVVPLFLILSRSVPSPPAGTAAPPGGLSGIGSGIANSPAPTVAPTDGLSVPDGIPPASPVGAVPVPVASAVPVAAGAAGGTGGGVPGPPSPDPAAPRIPFQATYTVHSGLTGYDGSTVTIVNPDPLARAGWTVVMKLPVGELVSGADGAKYAQPVGSTTVTFTPVATSAIPAHGAYHFSFTVAGTGILGGPVSCTIDANPCQLTK